MAKNSVTLRLGVEGDEQVLAALRKIGQQGTEEFKKLPKEARQAARSFDALERSLDPAAKSAHQLAKAYVDAQRAVATGARTNEEAARVLDIAAQRHKAATAAAAGLTRGMNDNAQATGLARYELINLGRQIGDIGTMLASGSSPFQVLATQGAQVAEIFGSSKAGAGAALKDFAGIVGRMAVRAGPVLAVAAALGEAAHAAFGYQAAVDSLTVSLNGLGRQSGLTVSQVMRLADANAGRMSNADARGLAGQFLGAGAPAAAVGGALGVASDMQRKLGLDMESVGKTLSDALADPARGAEQLAKQYGLVYFEEEQHIKQLAAVGERSKAAAELIAVLQQNMKGLEDPTWKAVDAIGLLKKGLSDWQDDLGKNLNEWFFGRRNIARWEAEAQKRADENRLKAEADVAARREADLAKLREDGQFAVREIQARTFAERDLLAQQRAYQQTLRDTNDAVKASISAENERARMLAESRRRIDDYAQGGARALEMARMSPYERGRQQIRNEYKDLIEQYLPRGVTSPVVTGMNNVAGAAERAAAALSDVARAGGSNGVGRLIPLSDWKGGGLDIERARRAITSIESGGNYRATANAGRGRTALGRYQILNTNLGAYADGMSPSDFLNNPAAQDRAFERMFTALFKQYGNVSDAASAYFTGRPLSQGANARDAFGTTGSGYVAKFLRAYNGGEAPAVDAGSRRRGIGVINIARNDNRADAGAMRGDAERGLNDRLAAFDYENITRVIDEANAEIERQNKLLAVNEDTFSKSTEEKARAAKEQELLNQFSRQGIYVNNSLFDSIQMIAEAEGRRAKRQEESAIAQNRLIENMDAVRGASRDFLGGMISDLRQGESGMKALENAAGRLADRLASMAADRAIEALFGRSGSPNGGIFGGLLSGIFGGMGGASSPVASSAGYVPQSASRSVNVSSRGAQNGSPVINFINQSGAVMTKRETRQPNGQMRYDVVLKNAVASTLKSPEGADAMGEYGVAPMLAQR